MSSHSTVLTQMGRLCFQLAFLKFLLSCFMACNSAKKITNFTTDQSALLAFRAHITHHPSDILNNWSTNISICNWIGVSCGVHHQRIVALSLSNMGLKGTISPHLGNLTFLISLDVSFNSFNGIIPQELAHLRRLKTFNLQYNEFRGEVPSWFGFLPKLQHVLLHNNSFTGTIPTSLCNISKLETLNMMSNFLHGPIPEEIANLSSLKSLNLSHNQLMGSIPFAIYNLSSLREIHLSDNKLTDSLPVDMCDHLPKLQVLYLFSNQLHGQIPHNLYKCRELQGLSLFDNEFHGSIPREIGKLPMLKKLDLAGNRLTGEIPMGVWESKGLQIVSLSRNGFTGGIPKKVGNLTFLKELYLKENHLTGALPDEIGNLNLENLDVCLNSLTGNIPFKIFNISTMKKLTLSFNHFSGHLPSIIRLPNLEELHLSSNELSGTIPSSLGNASKLTVLFMSNNSFTGSIPNSFGDLILLQQLYLRDNHLTKESFTSELRIFTYLANCRQLERLSLSSNNLNGILPASFGNLSTSLQMFEATGCKLKGSIPLQIGNLSSLDCLRLDRNELIGSIPTTFGRLKHLQYVNLRQNRLQGSIPNDLCLTNLGDIYLSDNQFTGSIPACLGEVKSLRWLYLDSNKLTSTIPLTLWGLKDLLGLNFSSNCLSGYLPPDIESLKVLTEIDVSWNQLTGDIPGTIGGAQLLSYLSLAHNTFQGSIPQSVGSLINLESLDLSSNKLSGVIPKSFQELRYLKHFNVSFNKLEGEIPNGGGFANFAAQSCMENVALCGAPRLLVQPCKVKTHRQSLTKVVQLVKYILPLITVAALVVALIIVLTRHRKRNTKVVTQEDSLPLAWRRVSYHELVKATDAFCESNLLGMGSVGSVYEGILSDGMRVAVKVFNLKLEGAFKSFEVECEVMRNIRHRNLVKIISSSTNLDFKALVLAYMPNGSLEKWLYSHNYSLDILRRLNIMIDVATALEYLHHGHATPIVHCDLKPSNILLDEDMIAYVGDFGIAKLLGAKEFIEQTKTLATIGYMAPEYGMDGIVSTRGDVYSYGIVLMETFTRKKPTDALFSGEMSLRSWVLEASYDSILRIVDTNLIGRENEYLSAKEQCLSSIFALALACSKNSPTKRMVMEGVVTRLKKIKTTFLENTCMTP